MLLQILEDVSEEHARKTITVDPFPHSGVPAASIHPCKHASVMKKLGNMAEANGKPLQVDRYVVLQSSHHDQQVMVSPGMLCFVPHLAAFASQARLLSTAYQCSALMWPAC